LDGAGGASVVLGASLQLDQLPQSETHFLSTHLFEVYFFASTALELVFTFAVSFGKDS
jgi:hypothetical protein